MFNKIVEEYSRKNNYSVLNSFILLIDSFLVVLSYLIFANTSSAWSILIIFIFIYIINMIMSKVVYKINSANKDVKLMEDIMQKNELTNIRDINIFREYLKSKTNKKNRPSFLALEAFALIIYYIIIDIANMGMDIDSMLTWHIFTPFIFIYYALLFMFVLNVIKYIYLVIVGKYKGYDNMNKIVDYIYFKKQQDRINSKNILKIIFNKLF